MTIPPSHYSVECTGTSSAVHVRVDILVESANRRIYFDGHPRQLASTALTEGIPVTVRMRWGGAPKPAPNTKLWEIVYFSAVFSQALSPVRKLRFPQPDGRQGFSFRSHHAPYHTIGPRQIYASR
jgi:hypothetical protein